jgi:hypothetical protein
MRRIPRALICRIRGRALGTRAAIALLNLLRTDPCKAPVHRMGDAVDLARSNS